MQAAANVTTHLRQPGTALMALRAPKCPPLASQLESVTHKQRVGSMELTPPPRMESLAEECVLTGTATVATGRRQLKLKTVDCFMCTG